MISQFRSQFSLMNVQFSIFDIISASESIEIFKKQGESF